MKRIWVIATITFHEAVRKKLLAMALMAGAAFLTLFAVALYAQVNTFDSNHVSAFLRRQMLSGILTVGMYAVNFLIVAMTVLTAVDTLSGEIASGTIQAIAIKPIHRWELLCGKWLGFCGMLTLYALIMILGMNATTLVIAGVSARHLAVAFGLMWMESMLLLSTTLCFSVSFSTLTTGAAVLGLHGLAFLAGWIEQAGTLTHTPAAVTAAIVASLVMPSEALWRRAAFEMQSPLTTALNITPFAGSSVPSEAMIIYAAAYMLVMVGLAVRRFNRRDL